MHDEGLLSQLASHPFSKNLSDQHLMSLALGAQTFTRSAGQVLAREGEPASYFYLIQEGHVSVELHKPDRGHVPVQTVGPGEVVGWSWLVPPHQWAFDCRAMDTVKGLLFDAQWLREQCVYDHELGYQILQQLVIVIASRLAATRVQLLDIYK